MEIVRRAHARVACDRPVEVLGGAAAGLPVGAGHALDLSLAGALIAYAGELKLNTPYRLRLPAPDGAVDLPFRVAREAPRGKKYPALRHYGLVFNLTSDQERRLRKVFEAVRSQPAEHEDTLLDRLMRRYWSR